ncbi:MAG TPA: YdeI/OmpD-associated family protein, partial [Verrucomicrobiae bacterium]
KRSSKARVYFDTLPPSCRREYIEWISTAKRDETRERRLAEAIEMLSAGRRHNEQYRAKT